MNEIQTYTQSIVDKYKDQKGALIPLLQNVQTKFGYVPKESVDLIAQELSIYPIKIYEILTFYAQFYLEPRGKNIVRVCQGTACHVMGGKDILDYLSNSLGLHDGETTEDSLFTLERVACLGCCGMAPVVQVNEKFYGLCSIQKIEEVINKIKNEEKN